MEGTETDTQPSILSTPAATLKLRLSPGLSVTNVRVMFGKPYEICTHCLLRCNYHEVWRTTDGRLRVFYVNELVEKWAVEPT